MARVALAGTIAGARYVEMATGHVAPLEKPEEFAALVLNFLKSEASHEPRPEPAGAKVFWFFFSKKNGLLMLFLIHATVSAGCRRRIACVGAAVRQDSLP